jgi:hypothetical protein
LNILMVGIITMALMALNFFHYQLTFKNNLIIFIPLSMGLNCSIFYTHIKESPCQAKI